MPMIRTADHASGSYAPRIDCDGAQNSLVLRVGREWHSLFPQLEYGGESRLDPQPSRHLQRLSRLFCGEQGISAGLQGDDLARDCCAHHPVQWGAGSPDKPVIT